MTLEEIKNLTGEQLEVRMAEIQSLNPESVDADDLEKEVSAIENRKAELIEAEENRKLQAEKIACGELQTEVKEERKEETVMTNLEIRKSTEYINAFANYIKTEKDAECRALLTENVEGMVPVPVFIEELIKTAWERDGVMSRVRKSFIRGNLRIGFEVSATGAEIHIEGTPAPEEEQIVIGVINLIPESIKKWITISDEAMDMGGEAFLRYIYDEITYQITRKASDILINLILDAPTETTTEAIGVSEIQSDEITQALIVEALGTLSDYARNPVIIMNRATYAAFKAVQYAGQFNTDIFEGLDIVFSDSLPSFAEAAAGETYAIVGDLGRGALANFPNGQEVRIKYDDLSLAELDLVKIVGREYVALGIVAPRAFTRIAKEPLSQQ